MSKKKIKYTPVRNCPGIYRRPRSSGRGATWGVKAYDPSRRESVWVGSYQSLTEAKEAKKSFVDRAKVLRGTAYRRMTVANYAERWLTRKSNRQESTLRTYAYGIKRFVDQFGEKQLRELTFDECDDWAEMAPRSSLIAAKVMMGDAKDKHQIPWSPLDGVHVPPSAGRSDWPILSDADIELILETTAKAVKARNRNEVAGLIAMSAFLGLRMSETFALKHSHLELAGDHVRVVGQVTRNGELKKPKGGKTRKVALTSPALEALRRFPGSENSPFLYPKPDGNPYTAGSFHYHFRKVVAAVGIPGLQFHEFRHRFLAWLLFHDVPGWAISSQAGHGRSERLHGRSEVLLPVTKRYVRTDDLACEKVHKFLSQGIREFVPDESRWDFDPEGIKEFESNFD